MRLAPALLLTLAACARAHTSRPGQVCSPPPEAATFFAHAHNDYEHPHPLEDALGFGFHSVEADVFYDYGQFDVKHQLFDRSKGTLEALYLAPLQARVKANGTVFPDGDPFVLWLDLKDSDTRITEELQALLLKYAAMLTRIDGEGVAEGPITVVLTGDAAAKRRYVEAPSPRFAFRDSNVFSPDDPPADARWRYYALDWGAHLSWNGLDTPSASQQQELACLMENAAAGGRKVRLYNSPELPSTWEQLRAFGLDFIGTDRLEDLSNFLSAR